MENDQNGYNTGENQSDKDKILSSLFYDISHPVGYGSLSKIYRYLKNNNKYQKYKFTKKYLTDWLSKQEVYGVYRPARRKFNRPYVLSFYQDYLWDLDTASMTKYKEYNDGYSYFAVFIDIFTRYLYTYPLKTLTGEEMVQTMKVIFTNASPTNARCDMGSEYVSYKVQNYLKELKIKQIFTKYETKANYAERVIRTLKLKLVKYMSHNETFKWINVLDKATSSYNMSYHRSIGMTPTEAQTADKYKLWKKQYDGKSKNTVKKVRYRYNLGDRVRISYLKGTFDREYSEKWSTEIYAVIEKKNESKLSNVQA